MDKKLLKRFLCLGVGAAMLGAFCLCGCGENTPKDDDPSLDNPSQDDPQTPPKEEFSLTYRSGYTLTKFQSIKHNNDFTELADGVTLVKNTAVKTNGDTCIVYSVEVDLSKANIVAGTADNATYNFDVNSQTVTRVPYAQATAWETATGGKVYASMNADYFGWTAATGNYTCNALVKDGYILSDSHVDKGGYNYKNSDDDVPASAPLLFGVKGKRAQIAPIVSYEGDVTSEAVKEKLVKSKLFYKVTIDGQSAAVAENVQPSDTALAFATKQEITTTGLSTVLKVDVSKGYGNMTVLEKVSAGKGKKFSPVAGEYAYLAAPLTNTDAMSVLNAATKDGKASITVASEDGTWNGYTTILGCRHTLVLNDAVADTVALESSNGAKRADVPRTCIGVKADGTAVLFMTESLYYGNKAQESDPHGMSLEELAEFVCYYGCKTAANFDGGGSSQLITSTTGYTASNSDATVRVRSSDTGSNKLESARKVMTTILVTSKKA